MQPQEFTHMHTYAGQHWLHGYCQSLHYAWLRATPAVHQPSNLHW